MKWKAWRSAIARVKSVIAVVFLVTVFTYFHYWAIGWYRSSTGQERQFTPGDLGSAYNIPLIAVAVVGAYFAFRAYRAAQYQAAQQRLSSIVDLIDRSLSSALEDYRRRASEDRARMSSATEDQTSVEDSFKLAYNWIVDHGSDTSDSVRDKRWQFFRTANYILKPLSYWYGWAQMQEETDELIQSCLAMSARRIIASMDSSCQVYVLMAHDLCIQDIVNEKSEYHRRAGDHEALYLFLEKYAPDELDGCRTGNPAQMRRIEKFMQENDWFSSANLRNRLF